MDNKIKEAFDYILKSHDVAIFCMGMDEPDPEFLKSVSTIKKEIEKLEKDSYILSKLREEWRDHWGIPNGFEDSIKDISKEYENNVQQTKEQSKELYK